jgi:hypothetical protein
LAETVATEAGGQVMTPQYASPEQLGGARVTTGVGILGLPGSYIAGKAAQ